MLSFVSNTVSSTRTTSKVEDIPFSLSLVLFEQNSSPEAYLENDIETRHKGSYNRYWVSLGTMNPGNSSTTYSD